MWGTNSEHKTHRERLLMISLCVWVTLLLKGPRVSLSLKALQLNQEQQQRPLH